MQNNNAIVTPEQAIEPVTKSTLDMTRVQAQSTELALIKQKSQLLLESGMLPRSFENWQQVAVVMIRGRELDVPDLVALQHIFVVHGNTAIDGQLTLALLESSGLMENFHIAESSKDTCSLLVKRVGRKPMLYTCTREDAAGLKMKEGSDWKSLVETAQWRMQPRNKLFLFTVKAMSRALFADVINGMAGNRTGALVLREEFIDSADYEEVAAETESPLPVSVSEPNAPLPVHVASPDSEEGEYEEIEEVRPGIDSVQLGSLDMAALLNRASRAGLVQHPAHFNNLLRKMLVNDEVSERMTTDQVLDAMRKHKAAKEMGDAP